MEDIQMANSTGLSKRRVAYFYDSEVGNYHYGDQHPMKPHRVRMTHHLIVAYGLHKDLEIFQPELISEAELTRFHSDEYIGFLSSVSCDNMYETMRSMQRFNVGEDCPVFDGLFDFCRIYTSGSVGGARRLNNAHNDVVINWSGGLHHAKKCEASGFCYVNDCVLAILELLKVHQRVLYIDIDIHHGDGVEEAFYATNRVMTCSFHKYGDYFPGTGDVKDVGVGKGRNYSINFPLREGMNDESFIKYFKIVIDKIFQKFQPQAVVLQCGADSLSGDRLGCFNLSLNGHAECVRYVMGFNTPTLVLGGGGYTMRNVARCWTYETAIVLNKADVLQNQIPNNRYFEYYGPDYKLHISPSNMENNNSEKYLETKLKVLLQVLDSIDSAPGVQISNYTDDTLRGASLFDASIGSHNVGKGESLNMDSIRKLTNLSADTFANGDETLSEELSRRKDEEDDDMDVDSGERLGKFGKHEIDDKFKMRKNLADDYDSEL